jgi:hypothetical protein
MFAVVAFLLTAALLVKRYCCRRNCDNAGGPLPSAQFEQQTERRRTELHARLSRTALLGVECRLP